MVVVELRKCKWRALIVCLITPKKNLFRLVILSEARRKSYISFG
jgi:hypothetical protein